MSRSKCGIVKAGSPGETSLMSVKALHWLTAHRENASRAPSRTTTALLALFVRTCMERERDGAGVGKRCDRGGAGTGSVGYREELHNVR